MLEALIGALLAGGIVFAFRHAHYEKALRFWAMALIIAAAIYVGFVLVAGAPTRWYVIEIAGLSLFTLLAIVGLRLAPWLLAAAWLAHVAWDTLLHAHDTPFVPDWYPPLCAGFDLVVGVHLIFLSLRLRNTGSMEPPAN